MFTKKLLFVLIIILLASLSQAYYADITVDVSSNGLVSISGQTDLDNFLVLDSDAFTSKNDGLWILNVSLAQELAPFVYEINLPAGVDINYMNLPALSSVKSTSSSLVISGVSQKTSADLIVQYSLPLVSSNFSWIYFVFAFVGTFIFVLLWKFYFKKSKSSKRLSSSSEKLSAKELFASLRYRALSDRQKIILQKIAQKGKFTSQAVLEKELEIPKSSLSRNIDRLCAKGFLQKEKNGMSNTLYLANVLQDK